MIRQTTLGNSAAGADRWSVRRPLTSLGMSAWPYGVTTQYSYYLHGCLHNIKHPPFPTLPYNIILNKYHANAERCSWFNSLYPNMNIKWFNNIHYSLPQKFFHFLQHYKERYVGRLIKQSSLGVTSTAIMWNQWPMSWDRDMGNYTSQGYILKSIQYGYFETKSSLLTP